LRILLRPNAFRVVLDNATHAVVNGGCVLEANHRFTPLRRLARNAKCLTDLVIESNTLLVGPTKQHCPEDPFRRCWVKTQPPRRKSSPDPLREVVCAHEGHTIPIGELLRDVAVVPPDPSREGDNGVAFSLTVNLLQANIRVQHQGTLPPNWRELTVITHRQKGHAVGEQVSKHARISHGRLIIHDEAIATIETSPTKETLATALTARALYLLRRRGIAREARRIRTTPDHVAHAFPLDLVALLDLGRPTAHVAALLALVVLE